MCPQQPNPAHQLLQSARVSQRSLAAPLNGSSQTGCKLKFAPASGCDQLLGQCGAAGCVARGAAAGITEFRLSFFWWEFESGLLHFVESVCRVIQHTERTVCHVITHTVQLLSFFFDFFGRSFF
jgi:hypothetical protein